MGPVFAKYEVLVNMKFGPLFQFPGKFIKKP